MKHVIKRLLFCIIVIVIILTIFSCSYAHPGRTDSNGGHKDKNNVSGLGSYHYHCGGNPAHLHPNGICPYSKDSSSNSKSTNTKSTTSKTNIEVSNTNSKPLAYINQNTKTENKYNTRTNSLSENKGDSNVTSILLTLGILGGIGYLGCKKR